MLVSCFAMWAQGEVRPRRALVVSDSDDDGAATTKPRRALAIESDDEDSDTSVLPAGQQMRTAIDLTRDGEPMCCGHLPGCTPQKLQHARLSKRS